jgi:hypothetical protein
LAITKRRYKSEKHQLSEKRRRIKKKENKNKKDIMSEYTRGFSLTARLVDFGKVGNVV